MLVTKSSIAMLSTSSVLNVELVGTKDSQPWMDALGILLSFEPRKCRVIGSYKKFSFTVRKNLYVSIAKMRANSSPL